jgi:glycosyltransferase involved in cell wall biosynthesis
VRMAHGSERVASLRVLHVMWALAIGGAERALYQLVLAQRASGVDAGVMIASTVGLYGERLGAAGVPVECLGQRRSLDIPAALRARSVFARWDVVHFHVAEPPLMLSAALTPGRMYFTHRAGAFRYPYRRLARYRAAGFVLRRRYDGVVGNTAHAADVASTLFSIPRQSIGVVYNGIDWDLLRPERDAADLRRELGVSQDQFVLGTTGNLRDCKRVDLVIRALARAGRKVVLIVVGDGPARKQLEALTRSLGLDSRTRFAGERSNVADYLQVFDAFVLASGGEESFGNSAVEAMGFGVPTIVLEDGGGLTEHVIHEETGLIATGVEDMAAWFDRLAVDPNLRAMLGARGRIAMREKYTIGRMLEGYAELYSRRRDTPADRIGPT